MTSEARDPVSPFGCNFPERRISCPKHLSDDDLSLMWIGSGRSTGPNRFAPRRRWRRVWSESTRGPNPPEQSSLSVPDLPPAPQLPGRAGRLPKSGCPRPAAARHNQFPRNGGTSRVAWCTKQPMEIDLPVASKSCMVPAEPKWLPSSVSVTVSSACANEAKVPSGL